jgi:hypothetical protein
MWVRISHPVVSVKCGQMTSSADLDVCGGQSRAPPGRDWRSIDRQQV